MCGGPTLGGGAAPRRPCEGGGPLDVLGIDCRAAEDTQLTRYGSATGRDSLDTDHDGTVTCEASDVAHESVRRCLETACVCRPGSRRERGAESYGDPEATRVQGGPGRTRP